MSGRSESIRRATRVLLVVQEKTTSLVLRQVLEKEGFAVMPIHAPEDAPAGKTGRNKFHLIVIDSELPDEAGFKLLEDFRRQQRYSRVPIIMLTSRNSEPDAMRAFELGANEYVSRPISPTGFAARVRHQLARGVSVERQATTYRLLLADDETNVLLTTGTALHRHGTFTVYLACGGKDVCDRFDEIVPNVVLLDHGMLAARGGAVSELLERMKRTGEAKVLLAVGEGVTVAAETLEECGVQGTIRKPYQLLTLGDQIQAVAGLPARLRKSTPSPEHLNNEIERVLGVQVET
jgi:DNA-binding response OmpR family regulator